MFIPHKHMTENEVSELLQVIEDVQGKANKSDAENKSKDNQILGLQDEISQWDVATSKLSKEKKRVEEELKAVNESLQDVLDKNEHLARSKLDLEREVERAEVNCDGERRAKAELEKAKRRLEADLKASQDENSKTLKQKADLEDLGKCLECVVDLTKVAAGFSSSVLTGPLTCSEEERQRLSQLELERRGG